MRIQKAQLISDLICYGPCPLPDEEVEQRLTISASGRVWMSGYNFGAGFGHYVLGRRQQIRIDSAQAETLLRLFADLFQNREIEAFATDIGCWTLRLTDVDGRRYKMTGSMCGNVFAEGLDVSDCIRKAISIKSLALFGGCDNAE